MIGLGIGENFVASGVTALLPVTQRFIYLEQGDLAEISRETVRVFDASGNPVSRPVHETQWSPERAERGPYRHFMLKEIFDQPAALADTLYGRVAGSEVVPDSLGPGATELLAQVRQIHIVACGTSFHAGAVGRYWLEAPLSGRDRQRVPLSARGRPPGHAVRDLVAVGRDRRHTRGSAHRQVLRLCRLADDLQQPAQLHGARIGLGHDDPGGARAPRPSPRSCCRCCS